MKQKILLDGYGTKLKSIRAEEGYYEDLHPDGLSSITIKTDKGDYEISGCSYCETIFFYKKA